MASTDQVLFVIHMLEFVPRSKIYGDKPPADSSNEVEATSGGSIKDLEDNKDSSDENHAVSPEAVSVDIRPPTPQPSASSFLTTDSSASTFHSASSTSIASGTSGAKESAAGDAEEEQVDVGEVVRVVLKSLSVELKMPSLAHAIWTKQQVPEGLSSWQVTFFSGDLKTTDAVWNKLNMIGLGKVFGSMAVLPTVALRSVRVPIHYETEVEAEIAKLHERHEAAGVMEMQGFDMGILHNHVYKTITSGSELTFDFLMMVITAGALAGVALATNNTVVIVASMLVSPMMGPILGITFGFVIKSKALVLKALRVELFGLCVCICLGFVVGSLFGHKGQTHWGWPTQEMKSRTSIPGLLIGVAIAVPSGVGVAISVLTVNSSSLVGVAISASLLPPCVNAGLLFSMALWEHTHHTRVQCFTLGFSSVCLTLVNISCILVAAGIVFKLKIYVNTRNDLKVVGDYFMFLHNMIENAKQGGAPQDLDDAVEEKGQGAKGIEYQGDVNMHDLLAVDLQYRAPKKKAPPPATSGNFLTNIVNTLNPLSTAALPIPDAGADRQEFWSKIEQKKTADGTLGTLEPDFWNRPEDATRERSNESPSKSRTSSSPTKVRGKSSSRVSAGLGWQAVDD
eukprot:gb/GEZN01003681.1/.p1 GENE.gb/GEZN01003681.1/~~gb/GEZN01003681.1/.p1  ORF type:complete len:624 (-),score=73.18 gb/GEZN01003681.1/:187-2058(-)